MTNPNAEDEILRAIREQRHADAAVLALSAHGPAARAWLTRCLRCEDEANEVYQEVTQRVLRGIAAFRGEPASSGIASWIYTIARRESFRHMKRRARARARERRLDTGEVSRIPGPPTPSAELSREERRSRIEAVLVELLEHLPTDDVALLTLRYIHDLPHREIADRLSIPGRAVTVDAVKQRLSRAKRRVKDVAARGDMLRVVNDG